MNQEMLYFNNRPVEIRRRAFKRSIGITLAMNGSIRVSAPKLIPLSKIFAFLKKNTEWIESNLAKYAGIREQFPQKHFAEGEQLMFMGELHTLRFKESRSRKANVVREGCELQVQIPIEQWTNFKPEGEHPEVSRLIARFFEKEARVLLAERLVHFSERMQLFPNGVSFRSQKTRWGSCSSKGRLSLNWRLIIAPLEVIDYVIVHELSHLRFYDHSEKFWNLVATQIPRYRELREWLRAHQYDADFLAVRSEIHPQ